MSSLLQAQPEQATVELGRTTHSSKFPRFFKMLGAALPCLAGSVKAFDLQAHRGGRGLRPENTLAAFESAARLGDNTLALDIDITTDSVRWCRTTGSSTLSSHAMPAASGYRGWGR